MAEADVLQLTRLVLWCAFFLAVLFGAISQRTHFCTMGAIADVVTMGDWTRMRQWALAAGVAILGTGALAQAGLIDPARSVQVGLRWPWLSALTGGLLFGVGMVLASGCGGKTLVRLGGGNLKSLVVFLVMALTAFMTLKGITAVARSVTVDRVALDLAGGVRLPALVAGWSGLPVATMTTVLAVLTGGAFLAWALVAPDFRRQARHVVAGVGVGLIVPALWWVSGSLGHVAEHPRTLEDAFLGTYSGRMEALSFSGPLAHTLDWLLFFSDAAKELTMGVVVVAGVASGACLAALASGTFRWEGFAGVEDLALHLAGGALMGMGGVTALGCTFGHGLSGLSVLSLTSFTALAGIFAGARLALGWQMWRIGRGA